MFFFKSITPRRVITGQKQKCISMTKRHESFSFQFLRGIFFQKKKRTKKVPHSE